MALNFANPIAKNAGPINGQQPGVQYSGDVAPRGRNGFGYLDTQQIGTDQWGTGSSFQGAGRQAVVDALQGSVSNANPLDTAGSDEARQYLRDSLAGLPDLQANKNSLLDTSMQRGLKNLLAQHSAGAAGTGSLGSRQFGGAAGDITSRMGSDYMTGLIQDRADAINQGLNISGGLRGIQSGDLAERQFQLGQGQALANGYMGLIGQDAQRQAQLESERYGSEQQDKQMLNNDIMGIVQGGAMLAGGAPPMPKSGGGGGASVAPSNVYADTYGTPMAAPTQSYWNQQLNGNPGYYNPAASGYGYGG